MLAVLRYSSETPVVNQTFIERVFYTCDLHWQLCSSSVQPLYVSAVVDGWLSGGFTALLWPFRVKF